MDSKQAEAFYAEHCMKKGKDYRLEVLKMSKEDVYDYLDERHQDTVHGWRVSLQDSNIRNARLEAVVAELKQQIEILESR